jgi:hypothetical protein
MDQDGKIHGGSNSEEVKVADEDTVLPAMQDGMQLATITRNQDHEFIEVMPDYGMEQLRNMHAASVVHSPHLSKEIKGVDAEQEEDAAEDEMRVSMDYNPGPDIGRYGDVGKSLEERAGHMQRSVVHESEDGHHAMAQPVPGLNSVSLIHGVGDRQVGSADIERTLQESFLSRKICSPAESEGHPDGVSREIRSTGLRLECVNGGSDGPLTGSEGGAGRGPEIEEEIKSHFIDMSSHSYIHEGSIFGDQEMIEDG